MSNTTVTDRVQVPEIKLEGSDLGAAVLDSFRSLRVDLSMWMANRCVIRFYDADFTLADAGTFAIGKKLTVSLPTISGSMTMVFDGEVTDIALEQGDALIHELVVGAMDKGHRLSAQTKLRTFTNKTYADIVKTIAGDAGLTPNVTATSPAQPYVVQTTNDHTFLWEIAHRIGYDWWVSSDGKLNFKPRPSDSGPTLTFGEDLVDFKVRYSGAGKSKKVTVQGWNPDTQQAVTGDDQSTLSGSSIPAIGSSATLVTGGRSKAVSEWGSEMTTGAFIATSATEAQGVAKALAANLDAAEVFARGEAMSAPTLVPGKKVTVKGMGTKASGDYFVTSVEHTYGHAVGIETRFTAGNKAPVGLADLVGTAESHASWGVQGLVAGVVTNVDDPDKTGRVKVKFPSLSPNDESGWARVVALGAGNGRGVEILPEVNDEVLVGFEQGDLRFPVVLGGLWSKKNKPPITEAIGSTVKSRTIKSRLGHTIEIEDGESDDKKAVTITLADKKTKLRLGHDGGSIEVASGKPFVIKAGSHKIEIDDQGGITLKGQKITIEAATDLTLKGTNVKINANANVEIKANAQLKASGNAGANLETSAIAVVKGSMVKIN